MQRTDPSACSQPFTTPATCGMATPNAMEPTEHLCHPPIYTHYIAIVRPHANPSSLAKTLRHGDGGKNTCHNWQLRWTAWCVLHAWGESDCPSTPFIESSCHWRPPCCFYNDRRLCSLTIDRQSYTWIDRFRGNLTETDAQSYPTGTDAHIRTAVAAAHVQVAPLS